MIKRRIGLRIEKRALQGSLQCMFVGLLIDCFRQRVPVQMQECFDTAESKRAKTVDGFKKKKEKRIIEH